MGEPAVSELADEVQVAHITLQAPLPTKVPLPFLVGGMVMAVALGVLLYLAIHLTQVQRATSEQQRVNQRATIEQSRVNHDAGVRNRATICEASYVLGVRYRAGSSCLSTEVRAYWNPGDLNAYLLPAAARP